MLKNVLGFALAALLAANASVWGQEAELGSEISFPASGGMVGGAELTFLRPYVGDVREMNVDLLTDSVFVNPEENDFETGWRAWLGYVSPSGGGLRARYWQFDHGLEAETWETEFEGNSLSGGGNLDMYAVDVEFTQQIELGFWSLNGGAGLRVAGVDRNFSFREIDQLGNVKDFSLSNQFDGLGPTLFAEWRRPLGKPERGLVFLVNSRGSLLFGSRKLSLDIPAIEDVPFLPLSATWEDDSLTAIGEIQMGLEWKRDLANGSQVFANALWEGQAWGGTNNVVGLTGFTFGLGLAR